MPGYMPGHAASQPFFEYLPPHHPQPRSSLASTMPGYMPGNATMQPSYEFYPPAASQSYMEHLDTTMPGHMPEHATSDPPVHYTPQRHEGDIMTPSALPIRQSPECFKYATASLEGMPADLKLEILHALHHLPSLRLLKLASREYYLIARSHTRSLETAFREKYHPEKPWPRLDGAFFQAIREWHNVLRAPGGRARWHMPGPRDFTFQRNEWIGARIYRLTGEYPYSEGAIGRERRGVQCRKVISSHLQVTKAGFERRFESGELQASDLEHMEEMVLIESAIPGRTKIATMVATLRAAQNSHGAVEKGFRYVEWVNGAKRWEYVKLVNAAMEKDPQIAVSLLRELERMDVVTSDSGKYVLMDEEERRLKLEGEEGWDI